MISNRTKSNICLTLAILGIITIIVRFVDYFLGNDFKIGNTVSQVIITAVLISLYHKFVSAEKITKKK